MSGNGGKLTVVARRHLGELVANSRHRPCQKRGHSSWPLPQSAALPACLVEPQNQKLGSVMGAFGSDAHSERLPSYTATPSCPSSSNANAPRCWRDDRRHSLENEWDSRPCRSVRHLRTPRPVRRRGLRWRVRYRRSCRCDVNFP